MGNETDPLIAAAEARKIPMTQQMAVAEGDRILAALSGQMKAKREEVYVMQWGADVPENRAGEPARVTGKILNHNPEAEGSMGGFFAEIQYEDGFTQYVDMHLPKYPHGKKPPWWFSRKVYIDTHDGSGTVAKRRVSHIERPADAEHWLEFIKKSNTRPARKVQE